MRNIESFIQQRKPIIIAHRGGVANTSLINENSLEAIDYAIQAQANMIEFDVRFDKNNELIVFHDNLVNKIPVSDLSRSEIERATGVVPELLTNFLARTSGRILVDIELKDPSCLEQALGIALQEHSPDEILLTSFHGRAVQESKALQPLIKTGLLLGTDTPEPYFKTRLNELFPKNQVLRVRPDFLLPYKTLVKANTLYYLYKAGIDLIPWTVNSDKQLKYFLNSEQVSAVITDFPETARTIVNNKYRTQNKIN